VRQLLDLSQKEQTIDVESLFNTHERAASVFEIEILSDTDYVYILFAGYKIIIHQEMRIFNATSLLKASEKCRYLRSHLIKCEISTQRCVRDDRRIQVTYLILEDSLRFCKYLGLDQFNVVLKHVFQEHGEAQEKSEAKEEDDDIVNAKEHAEMNNEKNKSCVDSNEKEFVDEDKDENEKQIKALSFEDQIQNNSMIFFQISNISLLNSHSPHYSLNSDKEFSELALDYPALDSLI
jgi:hypothetical protein